MHRQPENGSSRSFAMCILLLLITRKEPLPLNKVFIKTLDSHGLQCIFNWNFYSAELCQAYFIIINDLQICPFYDEYYVSCRFIILLYSELCNYFNKCIAPLKLIKKYTECHPMTYNIPQSSFV